MRLPVLALIGALTVCAPAYAQFQRAIVSEAAPVYLRPDTSRTPLRRLPAGTTVTVNQIRTEWVQITFTDQRFGPRTGWIERRFITPDLSTPTFADAPEDERPEPARPAQPSARAPAPRSPDEGIGIRAFGTVAYDWMAAADSFDAIFGSRGVPAFGGGVQVTNLWGGLFVEVSAERSRLDGERVFVSEASVFPLGIPLELEMTPIDAVVGWRSAPVGGVRVYGAGGVTSLAYRETSVFAEPEENIDERFTGWLVLGGVEARVVRWFHVRGEARYRRIEDVLGAGGVSATFDEPTLGGFGAAVKFVVGR